MLLSALSTTEIIQYAYVEAKTPLEFELLGRLQAAMDEIDELDAPLDPGVLEQLRTALGAASGKETTH